jgi:hypothetical protein
MIPCLITAAHALCGSCEGRLTADSSDSISIEAPEGCSPRAPRPFQY